MKCIICHGDQIESTPVREEIRHGNDIVYVPIEVAVCRTCGERYYDRTTLRHIQEIERKLKRGEVALEEVGRVLVCADE